jgi:chromate transporter
MLLPGPEAQQLATYIGWLMHRTWGGIIAGGLFVLPSLFILIFLSWIYMAYGSLPQVAGVLYGIKPAVVAIVLFAAYRIGSRALKNPVLWSISALAFFAIALFNVPFPYIVFVAGLIGYMGSRIAPAKFATGGGHAAGKDTSAPAMIDDDTPTPPHAVFNLQHTLRLATAGLLIGGGALGLLALEFGWHGTLTRIGWFFTKAALLTFGGAYAVLPYVYQGAVQMHGWLTPEQMIDGLALGETTPGPLIMIVAFVGFVGGWTKALFGMDNLFFSGAIAACVATFFTFLPSFLFILIGGPVVESTQGNLKFTAPLTGITAAVVGVILNLAMFLAYHVIWPHGWESGLDWLSALAAAVAFIALVRFKVGIIPLIAVFGFSGLLHHLIT